MDNPNVLRPQIRLAAIIIKGENEVLLGKTKISPDAGKWIFPGGKMEIGDSYHRSIFSNLWKTIGLRQTDILLEDGFPKAVTNDVYDQDHYITLFFRARYFKRRPGIRDKEVYEELNWFKSDSLPESSSLQIENFIKQKYNPFS